MTEKLTKKERIFAYLLFYVLSHIYLIKPSSSYIDVIGITFLAIIIFEIGDYFIFSGEKE